MLYSALPCALATALTPASARSARSDDRFSIKTWAPRAAQNSAKRRPAPEVHPVTQITLPLSLVGKFHCRSLNQRLACNFDSTIWLVRSGSSIVLCERLPPEPCGGEAVIFSMQIKPLRRFQNRNS